MFRTLTTVCTLLTSLSASANFYDTSYQDRTSQISQDAIAVCGSLDYANSMSACLSTIQNKSFSPAAVAVCKGLGLYQDSAKIACLATIADSRVQKEAADLCGSFDYASKKSGCLATVKEHMFADSALQLCEGLGSYQDEAKINCLKASADQRIQKEAADLCSKLDYASKKAPCLAAIANHYFDANTINLCGQIGLYQDEAKISCLQIGADKIVQKEAADLCSSLDYASNKTSCLAKIAGKVFQKESLSLCGSLGSYRDDSKLNCIQVLTPIPAQTITFQPASAPSDLEITLDILDMLVNASRYQSQVRPAPAAVNTCYVKQTNQRVATSQFYALVSQTAASMGKCAVARMANTEGSGRLYDERGNRVRSELGGLTYKQVAEVKRNSSLAGKGCEEYICDDAR